MYHVNKLMKKTVVCLMLVVMLAVNLFGVVYAEDGAANTSAAVTSQSVETVKKLASDLRNNSKNSNPGNTGGFSWDTEGKNFSWTYYNGIMMDAFLMLDSATYKNYVETFYDANISSGGSVTQNRYGSNTYRANELDSIPPTRALFDLIRDESSQPAKYKQMIAGVYNIMENFTVVSGTDGNFIHKENNSNWSNYQVALDGMYMAQPFFMEIANALDGGRLTASDFPTATTKPTADALYSAVVSRLKWVGENLYDSRTKLYHHGWSPSLKRGNGQFWLRAIGWYAAALADVIDMLPDRFAAQRDELIAIEKQLFDGMLQYQDAETGMWYNVVNYGPELSGTSPNLLETSGSALVSYAMLRLYAGGYVEDTYGEAGLRAFNGVVQNDVYGNGLHNVYISSGVETTPQGYLTKGYRTNEAKGVGPLMMAAVYANAAAKKFNKEDPEWTQPTAKTGLTYNDKNQALVTAGTTEHGTIEYALGTDETTAPADENAWTTEVPSGKDAGTYYVWYRLKGDSAHNDAGPSCVEVQIAKAAQTAPAAPEADSSTINSITLKPTEGYEYSMDGQNWQKSNVFTDLAMDTEYTFYQRAAGDANHEASPASAAAKIKTMPHVHDWEYTAEGSTLTAKCKNTDGGHSGETAGTLTIKAPAHTVYGDKNDAAATVDGSIEGVTTPEIVYMNDAEDETLDEAPTGAGIYTAKITFGDAVARVTYMIAPKRVKITGLKAIEKVYDGTTEAEIKGEPKLEEDNGRTGLLGAIRKLVTGGAVEDGDEVSVEYGEAAFADANVGKDKTVTFTGFALAGEAAPNYALIGQPADDTANIKPKAVTVTAKNQKIEEGTEIYTGVNQAVLDGAIEGHSLSNVKFDAIIADKSIMPYDAVISDAAGNAVTGNYTITYTPGTLTVNQPADPTPTPVPSATPEPTPAPLGPGDLASDSTISVSGLETGDKVSFYQVLQFSPDAVATGGWIPAPGFTGLTAEDIQKILGIGDYAPGKSKADQAGIDENLAARIADMAEQTTAKYPDIKENKGTASKANPEPGLYVALITPGKPGTVYNPVFVGADYTGTNSSSSWDVTIEDSYEPASMAKKAAITLTKTASTADGNPDGVSAGDVVTFTLTTKIPEYGNDYTDAVFKVIDTLSAGLELQTGTIKVYKDSAVEDNLLAAADEYTSGKAYKQSTDTSGNDTFTVDFFTQYILGLDAAQTIVIQYQAKVTTDAPASVNLEDNTATVNYSNHPTDTTGKGTLRDETKHYTFDIDANILGDNTWKTTEVVKVALGADGKEITEVVSLHEGQSVGALEGAEFKLYVPVTGGTHEFKDVEGNTIKTEPYTNSILTSGKKIVSDGTGRLTIQGESKPGIRGLDIGTYYLVEEKAPAGYVKYQNAVKLEILAPDDTDHWTTKTYEEEINGYKCTWDVKELKKYEVKIDGNVTAEYTFVNEENEADTFASSSDTAAKGDTITGEESEGYIGREGATAKAGYGKIVNTQGAELPSTGGPGTLYFYLAGMFLLILAGTGFVLKRRMA